MAVLTPPEALPALLGSVLPHLAKAGPLDEDTLMSRFVPPGLRAGKEGDGASLTFPRTLVVGRSIGVLDRKSGGAVRIADGFRELLDSTGRPEQALRRWILAEATKYEGLYAEEEATRSRDLIRALTWFLLQDPTGPPLAWTARLPANSVEERQGRYPKRLQPFDNNTRWQAFGRWATYLGFARRRRVRGAATTSVWGLTPDLYIPVQEALLARSGDSRPLVDVLADIGDSIPVASGGSAHRALTAELDDASAPRVAPTLAQALLRLDEEGAIKLREVPDYSIAHPESIVLLLEGTDEERRFTHLDVMAGGSDR
jgi:hypothetical protein